MWLGVVDPSLFIYGLLKGETIKKVFIGGSRHAASLPQEVVVSLNKIMSSGMMVLVGDCSGVDTLVQKYFHEQGYFNVTVYFAGNGRFVMPGFKTKRIQASGTGRAWHACKDIAMAQDADYGLQIWNGHSQGTGDNISRLRKAGKLVKVWRLDLDQWEVIPVKGLAVNIRMDPYDVYVGRAGNGQDGYWGNPVIIGKDCPECGEIHTTGSSTLPCFRQYFWRRLNSDNTFWERTSALKGKTLGCFCAPKGGLKSTDSHVCHAQVILEWLEQ